MRGFARVSVAVPACAVGSTRANAEETLALWRKAHEQRAALVVFPELGLSSYTARDLFLDGTLLAASLASLERIVEESRELSPLGVVGLPLSTPQGLYNVAVAVQRGRVLGVVPKSYLPNYREFEERRWFRPGTEVAPGATVRLCGSEVPFGTDVLLEADGVADLVVGLEVCEDIWVQVPPSMLQVGAGATVCCNLSASNFTIGKADLRRLLARSASDRGKCAYLYVAAGPGESSTDLAFDADAFVCENGSVVAESRRFARESQLVTVDVDLDALVHDRRVTGTFGDCAAAAVGPRPWRHVPFAAEPAPGLQRTIGAHPFLPRDPATLATRAWEIFEIQTNALATRMAALPAGAKLVLGVSGGLDSTHAALVAAGALDLAKRPRTDLICVTMPGLGTSDVTKGNAAALAESLGATLRTISINDGARDVLAGVGHPAAKDAVDTAELIARIRQDPRLGDPTLENVQARMRTLILMTVANQTGGIVVGTGDLSEKALGWCTYSGDHISMYDVNAGVPKTLIQFVIRWVANERVTTWTGAQGKGDAERLRATLFAILDTPISPELLPPDVDGKIVHLTEQAIGPYELHDFYLFHLVRHGRTPARILDLARAAFGGRYSQEDHQRWLKVFLKRFFQNQFKRSCATDGPKVGTVALSPRGDWRMPSDARVDEWLAQVDGYVPES
ncbi:MAG: NAD(+) synthase [Deltaproteobacteria bacterium]|nr:NAD(+) synthase [Deltaproteobacteria bacterium]